MNFSITNFFAWVLVIAITIQFSHCTSKKPVVEEAVSDEPVNEKAIEKEPVVLFDGQTFDGWEGNMEMFRIEEGAIVAGTMDTDISRNEFLCSHKLYGNFELRLKARLIGEEGNAGIQFRSQRVPDHYEVIGYQCDIGRDRSGTIWGYLYDEYRRREFLTTPDNDEIMKVLNPDGWNEFVIRAEGPRVQIWFNDFQTVDYTEDDETVFKTGVICLQIHGGLASEAWYKDIEITEL